jgi:sugar (pentulose or hexulose) kinase
MQTTSISEIDIGEEIIKELVPEINLKSVTAIGSGNKSNFWLQLKSDILQIPYRNLLDF